MPAVPRADTNLPTIMVAGLLQPSPHCR